jgi:hypothetical protein
MSFDFIKNVISYKKVKFFKTLKATNDNFIMKITNADIHIHFKERKTPKIEKGGWTSILNIFSPQSIEYFKKINYMDKDAFIDFKNIVVFLPNSWKPCLRFGFKNHEDLENVNEIAKKIFEASSKILDAKYELEISIFATTKIKNKDDIIKKLYPDERFLIDKKLKFRDITISNSDGSLSIEFQKFDKCCTINIEFEEVLERGKIIDIKKNIENNLNKIEELIRCL